MLIPPPSVPTHIFPRASSVMVLTTLCANPTSIDVCCTLFLAGLNKNKPFPCVATHIELSVSHKIEFILAIFTPSV
ncbi:MAG: hypothetical protein BWY22_02120 [Bacteroidetes bacterium ADurb.Bin217]|nr:MAG: hypothetical protein BWY22_02120 [Bacteroidetes bacterium ADurb.Bin217]